MTIAYLRIAPNQDLDAHRMAILQLAEVKNLGEVTFIAEEIKAAIDWKKRQIATIIEKLGEGENLLAISLSSLGRSTLEIMHILVAALDKNINIYK